MKNATYSCCRYKLSYIVKMIEEYENKHVISENHLDSDWTTLGLFEEGSRMEREEMIKAVKHFSDRIMRECYTPEENIRVWNEMEEFCKANGIPDNLVDRILIKTGAGEMFHMITSAYSGVKKDV